MAGLVLKQLLDVLPRAPQLSRRISSRRRSRRTPPELLRYEEEAAERVDGRSPRDPAAEEVVDSHVGAGGGDGGGLGGGSLVRVFEEMDDRK